VRRYGVRVFKTREFLKQMDSNDQSDSRGVLQCRGESMDAAGADWVADAVQKFYSDDPFVVIDSVRTSEQLVELRARYDVLLVYLTADAETLHERWIRRDKTFREALNYQEAKANKTERNVISLMPAADLVVDSGTEDRSDYLRRVVERAGLSRAFSRTVDVLIGGQYGSEGKGNVISAIANDYDVFIRSGGPNAGHKVYEEPKPYCFHHIPSGCRINRGAWVVLAPGAVLYPPRLLEEIRECELTPQRLFIDPNAILISEEDREKEAGSLVGTIGSTGQGVGRASARKIMRGALGPVLTASVMDDLKPFIRPTREILEEAYAKSMRILVEGTQGTGLSLHHGPYPHCTSRDTSVSGVLSEAGIPPHRVRKVIMVCRTYPIRVKSPDGATSGPMVDELTFEEVAKRSGIPLEEISVTETTSTTYKKRRISEFDWELLRKSSQLNGPTDIALTFADYLGVDNRKATKFEELNERTREFIGAVEKASGAPVSLISTRFHPNGVIDRRTWK
jgi:adenylosuccinate synthase